MSDAICGIGTHQSPDVTPLARLYLLMLIVTPRETKLSRRLARDKLALEKSGDRDAWCGGNRLQYA
jgi:hypothetical protein